MSYIVKGIDECDYCCNEKGTYEVYEDLNDVPEDDRYEVAYVDLPYEDLIYEDDDKLKELYMSHITQQ